MGWVCIGLFLHLWRLQDQDRCPNDSALLQRQTGALLFSARCGRSDAAWRANGT